MNYFVDYWTYSFVYSAIYIVFVFAGKKYMENRPRYNLRKAMIVWSSSLAVFSITGTIRTLPELYMCLKYRGLEYSICDQTFASGVSGYWTYIFVLSKVFELGDTVFIVLRKQPLQLIHWYHHVSVLIYTWYSYSDLSSQAQWFVVMNYAVHSAMYTYYALRAMGIRLPQFVSIIITCLQLSQMFVGCGVNILSYRMKGRGIQCRQTYQNLHYSFLMYLSYLGLFSHFFYTRYVIKTPSMQKKVD